MDALKRTSEPNPVQMVILENMHKTLLEALRHREQEILRFVAILGPALAGFIWLLKVQLSGDSNSFIFKVGTVGVLLLLLLGAVYSLALGFNYRHITLQLAKLESVKFLNIRSYILRSWPRSCKDFAKRYKILWIIPWCTPPEIIKYFWVAFVIGIAGVTVALWYLPLTDNSNGQIGEEIVCLGFICFCIALLAPIWFGCKFQKACRKEEERW